ncbi:MAG TPA: CAP domain-containing protein [Candidatus Elarobacter sp.]|jgi:uncharacterized protein YkwD|nr:CAP domain-containing protein [Candidatus Elarobacter sp.]
MMRLHALVPAVALAAALAGAGGAVHAHAPASVHAPLVSANGEIERSIAIAFVEPQYPTPVLTEADALAADVNDERAKHGVAPLARDATLDRFAQAKAVEMAARGYFGHTDPDGITFQDRMHAWHWPVAYVGENIAFDRDEPRAHQAFVNSPPHEANIVDGNEKRIGVAVVTVGTGQTFYVEDFSAN